ncbi:TlpA family protein disulfide reductase [Motiliproteus coralliicola]|uniref:TlpA family protein disulfide reductase n=1 Tax=Motiliproteus coralliicola TaxID=2283196 RepID=A0A369WF96_9GAMM|nr:TlpA disulfide reductase family protein [Motiliproteus coralliicola]RDE18145.1 TlpA family protein disulfide reductase [Motiliproteus coralliicola]
MSVHGIKPSILPLLLLLCLPVSGWAQIDFHGHVQAYQALEERVAPPAIAYIDSDNSSRQLSELQGKPVVINFWASWCPTCLSEMASLQRLQQKLGDRARVLTLNQDLLNPGEIAELLNRVGAPQLPLARDINSRLGFALGQTLLPTTILLDADGKVAGQLIGSAEWDSPQAIALIDSLAESRPESR